MFRKKLLALNHPNATGNFEDDAAQKVLIRWLEDQCINSLKYVKVFNQRNFKVCKLKPKLRAENEKIALFSEPPSILFYK